MPSLSLTKDIADCGFSQSTGGSEQICPQHAFDGGLIELLYWGVWLQLRQLEFRLLYPLLNMREILTQ